MPSGAAVQHAICSRNAGATRQAIDARPRLLSAPGDHGLRYSSEYGLSGHAAPSAT